MKVPKAMLEKALGEPKLVIGTVTLFVPGNPPKVTHHDKHIAMRGDKMGLRNSPELEGAMNHYATLMPANPSMTTVLGGPLQVQIVFCWHDEKLPEKSDAGNPCRIWLEEKPDWDNAAKGVCDCLVKHRWIIDDKHITKGTSMKMATGKIEEAGVYISIAPAPPVPQMPLYKGNVRPSIQPY